jgi:DNA-binding Lrp family transcriptional regulator
MVMGVAMVKVAPGQHRSIHCTLKGKECILDLYAVSGEYDFFMIVQAESFAKLNRLMEDIQESHHTIKARLIGRLR